MFFSTPLTCIKLIQATSKIILMLFRVNETFSAALSRGGTKATLALEFKNASVVIHADSSYDNINDVH